MAAPPARPVCFVVGFNERPKDFKAQFPKLRIVRVEDITSRPERPLFRIWFHADMDTRACKEYIKSRPNVRGTFRRAY